MMTDREGAGGELPRELEDIETRLAARAAGIVPPERLRARVMEAVRGELVSTRPSHDYHGARGGAREAAVVRNGWWQFAATMAAAVLIGLNVAMAAAPSVTTTTRASRVEVNASRAIAQLRALLPELDERELRGLMLTSTTETRIHGAGAIPRRSASPVGGI
jgi:hypothetical protein